MDTTEQPKLSEMIAQLSALQTQPHVADEYVRFRIELVKAQAEALANLMRSADPAAGPPHIGRRTPLLDAAAVPMDADRLAALVESFRLSAGQDGHHSAVLDRLQEASVYEPELLGELARRAAFGPDQDYLDSLATRLEVSAEALTFVGRALAAPFVALQADRLRQAQQRARASAGPESGHCPLCGSPPALAQLEGEAGRRTLSCSLCGQRWVFARLACPFCGNWDEATLGTLTVADQKARWLEVCDACGGYIKTVDRRKLADNAGACALVEETATLHLDLLAEKAGYRRKLPYVALT